MHPCFAHHSVLSIFAAVHISSGCDPHDTWYFSARASWMGRDIESPIDAEN